MNEIKKIENAQQIVEIIKPIPPDQFTVDVYRDKEGKCCFLGHIHMALSSHKDVEDKMLGDFNGYGARQLTKKFLEEVHNLQDYNGVHVNDGPDVNGYNEPEIKDRVMHMLNDMVAAGY